MGIHEVMVRGKEDETTVVLYFDSWPEEERCVGLPLKQVLSFPMHCNVIIDILLSNVIMDINTLLYNVLLTKPLPKTTSFGNSSTGC